MNFRSTTLLFGLLLGMLWLFGLTVAHKKTAVDRSFLMESLQRNPDTTIDTVIITRRSAGKEPEQIQFTKSKEGDNWMLKVPGVTKSVKVESFKVKQIIDQVKNAKHAEEARITDDLAYASLDPPLVTVTLKGSRPGKEEEEWKFYLGKESADQSLVFVNSSDKPKRVYAVAKNNIDSAFFKDPNHLRARRIWEFNDASAMAVDVRDPNAELDLKKDDAGNWRFEKPALGFADFEGPPAPKEPPGAKTPAPEKTEGGVKGLLAAISTMRVDSDDDFVPLSDTKLDQYGLEEGKEALRIEVSTSKLGEKKELAKETLVIGKAVKDRSQVYARMLGDQGIFKLNTKLLEPIKTALGNPGTLRSMDVATIDPKKVDVVTVEQKGEKVSLYHPEGKPWEVQIGTGKLQKANSQAIQALVDSVQGKREILRFYDGEAFNKLDAEMKSPTATLTVYVDALEADKEKGKQGDKESKKEEPKKDEGKKDEAPALKKDAKPAATLTFAGGDKDTVDVQRVLADGTTSRFVLPRAYLDRAVGGDLKLAFLETSLPELGPDDVDRVTITRGKDKVDIEKGWGDKAQRWFFKEGDEPPGKNPTDTLKAAMTVHGLLSLSAKKWLHKLDPKEDLDKYGLKEPSLQVTLRVRKERPQAAAGVVGILATPSPWRAVLADVTALANRYVAPAEQVVLKIGKDTEEEKDKPAVYAQRSDNDLLFLLPADFARTLREVDLYDRAGIFQAEAVVGAAVLGMEGQGGATAALGASPVATGLVQNFDAAKVKELKLAIRTREELRSLNFRRDHGPKQLDWRDLSGLQEFNLDSQKVNEAVTALASLKASRWVKLAGGPTSEQKLTPQHATLRMEAILDDGRTFTLTVGAQFENVGYYAQTSAWPGAVFLLAPTKVNPYLQGPTHFAKERALASNN